MSVTDQQAVRWARLACRNLSTEFPHASQHVVTGPDESSRPAALHPAFHGSFDWHSAVHMHWLLVSLLTTHRDALAGDGVLESVIAVLNADLGAEPLSAEARYLAGHRSFERPYGWAWLLALHAATRRSSERAARVWATALDPCTAVLVDLIGDWLESPLPVRYGMHQNSAFALLLIRAAAADVGHPELVDTVDAAARRWFGDDRDAPWHWEPSAHDFLSPGLTEAALMARVLGPDFPAWWTRLAGEPAGLELLAPAAVADRSDGQQVHLFGLGLSRAWSLTAIGDALVTHASTGRGGPDEQAPLERLARANLDYGLAATSAEGEFMSDHWLASFAYLALHRPF